MEAIIIQLNRPRHIESAKVPIMPQVVKEIKQSSGRLFFDVLKEYVDKHIIENSLTEATREKYQFIINNITSYFQSIDQLNITIDQIRLKTMEEMKYWIQTVRIANGKNCTQEHASRHAEMCRRAMNYALVMEYTLNNPLTALKNKREKTKEIVHLEKDELEALINVDLKPLVEKRYKGNQFHINIQDHYHVIDLYVFQCFTGLSYADLYTYSVIEKEGRLWISNKRYKNDTPYYVPMFPKAKEIHEKYNGKLPHVPNQRYNRVIKRVVKLAGITKWLTTHTARKTFATHRDNEGWSMKTIADMMGNTPEVLQKHYLSKSTKRIETEMNLLGF